MLSDKRYGLSVNIMATRVMPSLLPQTVNPSLNLQQFTILIEVKCHPPLGYRPQSAHQTHPIHSPPAPSTTRYCKRCWTTSTASKGTNSSWTTCRFPPLLTGHCVTSSPRTTCTSPHSTSPTCGSTSGRPPVRRTWRERIRPVLG